MRTIASKDGFCNRANITIYFGQTHGYETHKNKDERHAEGHDMAL